MAGNSGDVKKEYDQVQRVKAGLVSVFPNQEAIESFLREDQGDLTPFIRLAEENNLIESGRGEKAFEAFIKTNALKPHQCVPPKDLNFAKLLVDKAKIKTSIRGLTGSMTL
jgi:hypothetical protein